jgi:hypothetical protein
LVLQAVRHAKAYMLITNDVLFIDVLKFRKKLIIGIQMERYFSMQTFPGQDVQGRYRLK